MSPSSKRTKALSIKPRVKAAVEMRDMGACIFCGMPGRGEAHFISRAQGGLGIEENLLTVCRSCHDRMDNSTDRKEMLRTAEEYLRIRYPYWDRSLLIYEKGIKTEERVVSARRNYEKQRTLERSVPKNIDLTKPPEGFWFIKGGQDDTGDNKQHSDHV